MSSKNRFLLFAFLVVLSLSIIPLQLPQSPQPENCGICGVVLFPKDNRSDKEIEFVRTIVKELLLCTQRRGKGATGVVFFYKDKEDKKQEPALLKGPKSATEFVKMSDFDSHIKKLGKETTFVIGHNRAPSQGTPKNNNNNHPVVVDPIYVVHNGQISNDGALFKKYGWKRIGDVDTEVIAQVLAHFGKEKLTEETIQKALSEIKGSWAIAFADKRDPYTLYLARDGCPMTYAIVPELEILVYDSELALIEDAWKKTVSSFKDNFDYDLEKIEFKEKVQGDVWPIAVCILFLSHLHEKDKDTKVEGALQGLVDYLSKQQSKEGGWALGQAWEFKTQDPTNFTSAVNLSITALGRAKSAGIKIDEQVFERAKKFYERTIDEQEGSFKYHLKPKPAIRSKEQRWPRTITAVIPLMILGVDKDKRYENVVDFARKSMAKAASNHVPQLHLMWAAYSFHALGKDDREKFASTFFSKLISRQEEDGKVKKLMDFDKGTMMQTWTDFSWGELYATANFALTLQAGLGTVEFKKD